MFGFGINTGILRQSVAQILVDGSIQVSAIELIGPDVFDVISGIKVPIQKLDKPSDEMITTTDEFDLLVQQVIAIRAQKATNQNITSSRSHLIFVIKLRENTIVFADLAGFESPKGKENIDETKFINVTLYELNQVLLGISRGGHLNHSANSLTKFLQPYLQAKSQTLMLYHVLKNSVHKDLEYIKDVVASQRAPKRDSRNINPLKGQPPKKCPNSNRFNIRN